MFNKMRCKNLGASLNSEFFGYILEVASTQWVFRLTLSGKVDAALNEFAVKASLPVPAPDYL